MVFAILIMLFPRRNEQEAIGVSLFSSFITFVLGIYILIAFPNLVEKHNWINFLGLNATYYLRATPIGMVLSLLVAFMLPIALIFASKSVEKFLREFIVVSLITETALIGLFLSRDLLLFYFFWELVLIPMYLLVGVWGGPKRKVAAYKFLIFTVIGSLFMLVGLIYLYTNIHTFDMDKIPTLLASQSSTVKSFIFIMFFLGFAIKAPLFPFHNWMIDAYVETPYAGNIILSGLVSKMGPYGFIVLLQIAPDIIRSYADFLIILGLISLLYAGFIAITRTDIKRLLSFISMSHIGLMIAAVASMKHIALEGVVIYMVAHGINTGLMFVLAGFLEDKYGTRDVREFGGLARILPRYSTVFMIVMLASIGLPGLNAFVGELLMIIGLVKTKIVYGVLGALTSVLGVVYLLKPYRLIFFGSPKEEVSSKEVSDLGSLDMVVFVTSVTIIFLLGIYPNLIINPILQNIDKIIR